jgi:hypothetical protein
MKGAFLHSLNAIYRFFRWACGTARYLFQGQHSTSVEFGVPGDTAVRDWPAKKLGPGTMPVSELIFLNADVASRLRFAF